MKTLLAFVVVALFLPAAGIAQPALTNYFWGNNGHSGAWRQINTNYLIEGSNLWFTNVRARAALSATLPVVYDPSTGIFSLSGLSGLGPGNYMLGMDSAGVKLTYKKLIAGTNVTIVISDTGITISAAGGGGGGSISAIKNVSGNVSIANPKAIEVDDANGLTLTQPNDTTARISLPASSTLTLAGLGVGTLNITSLNGKLLYQNAGSAQGISFGAAKSFLMGTGAVPAFGSITGSYGLDTSWTLANLLVTFRIDSGKWATTYALSLKMDKTWSITAGTGLTGGGDGLASRTLAIAATGVVAGSYGNGSNVPTFTVNAQGQLSAAGSTPITHANNSDTANYAKQFNAAAGGIGYLRGDTMRVAGTFTPAVTRVAVTPYQQTAGQIIPYVFSTYILFKSTGTEDDSTKFSYDVTFK